MLQHLQTRSRARGQGGRDSQAFPPVPPTSTIVHLLLQTIQARPPHTPPCRSHFNSLASCICSTREAGKLTLPISHRGH